MPKRKDDTIRNVKYNGHPPECTCVRCFQLKALKPSGETFDKEELDWVSTLKECPYCHKNSQMWNEEEKKIGCMNIHCQKYYEYI